MKRRILDMMMAACCMAVSFLGLAACDNELDIQQEYPSQWSPCRWRMR